MRNKKILITSLVLNSIIVALELFALSEVFLRYLPGTKSFKWYYSLTYYTNLSNILLLIASSIMLVVDIRELKGLNSKPWLLVIKFSAVIVTMITFLVVWISIPILGKIKFGIGLHGSMWLLLHTICPILGFISYVFFDITKKIFKSDILYSVIFTLLYSVFIFILFLTNNRVPYAADATDGEFDLSGWMIIIPTIVISLLCVGIGFLIRFLKNLWYYKNKK